MIGLIGHHGPRAVMACSVARPRRERETELHAKLRRDALLTHVRFIAISAMSRWTSAGIRGARDDGT